MAPGVLGLDHPSGDLVELEQVGRAPQVERQRALGEGAEPALEGADVGVVDVAVGHPGDVVADRLAPQLVGQLGHGPHLGTAGREQGDDLVLADLLARATPARTSATALPGARRWPAWHRARSGGRRRRRRPSTTGVLAAEALGVGVVEHGEPHGVVEPALGVAAANSG